MPPFLIPLLMGAGQLAEQWLAANAADRAAIEARAVAALAALEADRASTEAAHDARTKETEELLK